MTDLNHTSQEKYKGVLLEVAREVYNRVFGANDKALLQRLRDALRDLAAQEKKHREYMKEQYEKAIKAKKAFMVVSSDTQIPDRYKGVVVVLEQIPDEYRSRIVKYFSPVRKTTPPKQPLSGRRCYMGKDGKKKVWTSRVKSRPIDAHHRNVLSPPELTKAEAKERDLITLSCIYDNRRLIIGKGQEEKINDSIVPEEYEYGAIWGYIFDDKYFYEDKVEFMRSALRSIQPAQTLVKENNGTPPPIEYSLPATMTKWAYIFGISPNKLRELRENGTYHFRKISPRRWALPKSELPAEYLEKYRQAIPTQSQPKAQ